MGIGIGIFLLVLGAILAFAVHADLGWLDVRVVGWILLLAGAVELVITLAVWSRRRRGTTVTQREVYQDGHPTTVTERRSVNDPSVAPETGPGGSTRAPRPARRA
ncbi:DUF6458 family protein [Actinocatenispora rupis]|uniref:DUF6458 domain-containing protein n=1 Tax=Actinocatenispora rupis TaxID=519421 RepID=A0A8J3NF42_9ACTN|nr:DUF6458 family protein [Actinocatenispora rupis]GID13334.1 hypothetical protein Aru02nite_42230 [Actinocatenispora rupis]